MEKREKALFEALETNAAETEKWKAYKKENETAIENLEKFEKYLTVNVMVPIGRKAYMPGQLVHTNEILVGHNQDYFSKCSAHKAKEFCKHRIKMAEDYLSKLQVEAQLWQNKLEKPYMEGVVPNLGQIEIIEDYNEDQENVWREKHKLRVKDGKLREKLERDRTIKTSDQEMKYDNVFKMLEEAELLEELEVELKNLNIEDSSDETLRKLMSGEMEIPQERKRTAHNEIKKESLTKNMLVQNIENVITNNSDVHSTRKDSAENPDLDEDRESIQSDTSDIDLPKEIMLLKKQIDLLPLIDQVEFYDYQIQGLKQTVATLRFTTQQQLDEKIRLMTNIESFEFLLDLVEEKLGAQQLEELESRYKVETYESEDLLQDDILTAEEKNLSNKQKSDAREEERLLNQEQQKRRISFALQDETLEFCKNEAVSQMLPKLDTSPLLEKPKRDIIRLNDNEIDASSKKLVSANLEDKKKLILTKVESNMEYVKENQSVQDFDLVNKIITDTEQKKITLHIGFTHSPNPGYKSENMLPDKKTSNIPAAPADFYLLYKNQRASNKSNEPTTLFMDAYEGEELVKTPILRETDRSQAYKDPKVQFSKPGKGIQVLNDKCDNAARSTKSILRNRLAVEKETHLQDPQIDKSKKKKKA